MLDMGDGSCGERGYLGEQKKWGGRGEVFKHLLAIHFT